MGSSGTDLPDKRPERRGQAEENIRNHSGSKYLRLIHSAVTPGETITVDVYATIEAFAVRCPAVQHALKKLLCSGIRGKGDVLQDLREARDSITRAIQLQEDRER